MTVRTDRIATICKRANDLSKSVDELARTQMQPDFSYLSYSELILLISLTRKAHGCPVVENLAILKMSESELISSRHEGYGKTLQAFVLSRLEPDEQDVYQALMRLEN